MKHIPYSRIKKGYTEQIGEKMKGEDLIKRLKEGRAYIGTARSNIQQIIDDHPKEVFTTRDIADILKPRGIARHTVDLSLCTMRHTKEISAVKARLLGYGPRGGSMVVWVHGQKDMIEKISAAMEEADE